MCTNIHKKAFFLLHHQHPHRAFSFFYVNVFLVCFLFYFIFHLFCSVCTLCKRIINMCFVVLGLNNFLSLSIFFQHTILYTLYYNMACLYSKMCEMIKILVATLFTEDCFLLSEIKIVYLFNKRL